MVTEASRGIFEAIIANMAEGVIFLDGEDVIRICNPSAERIRGVRSERIVGRNIHAIHPPKMHHRIAELLVSLKSGTLASSSRVIQAQNRFFDNSYSAIRNASGDYLGTLLISRDITEQKRLSEENLTLRQTMVAGDSQQLAVRSEAMKKVLEMAEAVAILDSTVLVSGENGTGKERIVETIHQHSNRRSGPLVRVNCAALPEALIESELFGHVRGAFTGAVADHKGKFEIAHGGTLFLDELGELPLASQAKLLRAIQEKVVQPVGGRKEIRVDVRIVAATNRDLSAEVARGAFREDLYYRLNVIALAIPPLRERRDDILPLAELFMNQFALEMDRSPRRLSPETRAVLLACPWPGNVRQLRHAMERAVALGKGEVITPGDLPGDLVSVSSPPGLGLERTRPLKEAVGQFERGYIEEVLARHGGKKGEAARTLGISRKSLWEKVARQEVEGGAVTM